MVDGNVPAFREGDPVELGRRMEHALDQHVAELEIRLDLGVVQVVARLAHLLGVEIPVPRLDLGAALGVGARLDVRAFAQRLRHGGTAQRSQELECRPRGLGHLIIELPRGVTGKTQQLRTARTQLCEPHEGRTRVVGITAFGAGPRLLEQLPTGRPLLEHGERRLLGGVLQWEHISRDLTLSGRLLRGGDLPLGQTRELCRRRCGERCRLGGRQQFSREFVGKHGRFLVRFPQRLLVGRRESGSRADELSVRDLDQTPRLRAGREGVTMGKHRGHAREQTGVEIDGVMGGREFRRQRRLRRLQRLVGVRRSDRIERMPHAVEQATALLQRHQRVLEGRRRRIGRDFHGFRAQSRHARVHRRPVVGLFDLVEGRGFERQLAGRIEWIARPECRLGGAGGGDAGSIGGGGAEARRAEQCQEK